MSSFNEDYEEVPAHALGAGVPPHDPANSPKNLYDEDVECGWVYVQREVMSQVRRAIHVALHPCHGEVFTPLDCSRLRVAEDIIDGTFPEEVSK